MLKARLREAMAWVEGTWHLQLWEQPLMRYLPSHRTEQSSPPSILAWQPRTPGAAAKHLGLSMHLKKECFQS